jgi:hypothetical protein
LNVKIAGVDFNEMPTPRNSLPGGRLNKQFNGPKADTGKTF